VTAQLDIFSGPRWRPDNFDEHRLTGKVKTIFEVLKFHEGRGMAIKIGTMAAITKVDGRIVRAVLKHLRDHYHLLVGSDPSRRPGEPPGVFLIKTADEYKEWRRQMRGRAMSVLATIAIAERTTVAKLFGQMGAELEAEEAESNGTSTSHEHDHAHD
jgi:hypothetical protein